MTLSKMQPWDLNQQLRFNQSISQVLRDRHNDPFCFKVFHPDFALLLARSYDETAQQDHGRLLRKNRAGRTVRRSLSLSGVKLMTVLYLLLLGLHFVIVNFLSFDIVTNYDEADHIYRRQLA